MFTRREKLILSLWLLSWLLVPVAAQVRPGLFSTLVTTDTTANSLLVGGTAGGTTGTGGIKAGQMTLGGGTAITSSSNIALLNANNVFTATGNHTFGPGGTGTGTTLNVNGANASGAGGLFQIQKNGGTTIQIGHKSAVFAAGTAADLSILAPASSGIGFFTNNTNTERWGINSAGDHTFGSSSHIADSSGTPVIASGFGSSGNSIAGNDYAFAVSSGGSAGVTGTVTFGHTFSSAPVCVAANSAASSAIVVSTTTTQVTLTVGTGTLATPVYVLCRGY